MSKKTIVVNGIEYVKKDAEEEAPAEETTEETTEETPEEETPEEETSEEETSGDGKSINDATDEAVQKIVSSLGIDKLHKSIETLQKKFDAGQETPKADKTALLNLASLMKKDVSELTSREKVVGFFQAMVTRNEVALKALSEGTAADGGYLFPDEFRAEIVRDIADTPHMRNEVRVIPMRRDVLTAPSLVQGPQVSWTDENAAKSTTTAHFGAVTLTAYKMAAIMYVSDELIADAADTVDIVDFIVGLFSEAIGREEDKVITAGSGSSQPTGLTQASIGSKAVNVFSFDEVVDLEYMLPAKYYPNAKFYAHRNTISMMRKIKDNNGRYLWNDGQAGTQPSTFHGFPVVENNWLPESEIYFGDLKQAYWLGDRQSMTVKVSQDTETAFIKDQTAVRVVSRIAGNVVLAQAVKKLTSIP